MGLTDIRADSLTMELSEQQTPATLEEWIDFGVANEWISRPYCGTHDVTPMTPEEEAEWDDGSDPCSVLVRVWVDGRPTEVTNGRENW